MVSRLSKIQIEWDLINSEDKFFNFLKLIFSQIYPLILSSGFTKFLVFSKLTKLSINLFTTALNLIIQIKWVWFFLPLTI